MTTQNLEEIKNDFSVLVRSTQTEIKLIKNKLRTLTVALIICLGLSIYAIATNYFKISDLLPSSQKQPSKVRSKTI